MRPPAARTGGAPIGYNPIGHLPRDGDAEDSVAATEGAMGSVGEEEVLVIPRAVFEGVGVFQGPL